MYLRVRFPRVNREINTTFRTPRMHTLYAHHFCIDTLIFIIRRAFLSPQLSRDPFRTLCIWNAGRSCWLPLDSTAHTRRYCAIQRDASIARENGGVNREKFKCAIKGRSFTLRGAYWRPESKTFAYQRGLHSRIRSNFFTRDLLEISVNRDRRAQENSTRT